MSSLSPRQFGKFVPASDSHIDSTYPSWRDGEPMRVLAEAAVRKAKPYQSPAPRIGRQN